VDKSGKKWVLLADEHNFPKLVLDADAFLRAALLHKADCKPQAFCHRPITITDAKITLGEAIQKLKTYPTGPHDDVVDHDIILVWCDTVKRVITGADILGRLLRGITPGTVVSD
jgi:hypothetical protein